jgi:AMP phosphorylase
MWFKVKSLNISTGRPVAILNEKVAKKLAVFVGERVRIRKNHSIVAVLDISKNIIHENEIVLSTEIMSSLNIKEKEMVEVLIEPAPNTTRFILEKLKGKQLDFEKIHAIVGDIVHNTLTEAEIAYFVSGVYIHGMTDREVADLTKSMVSFGKKLNLKNKVYDKHSIGGVAGNRTTPIIVSICASAGITIPKTSSRAITSAAGTADVVETLASVEFSVEEIKRIVEKTNGCIVWGGALGLAPADDKIIQVEKLLSLDPEAQLIASILAKKISVNAQGVLIDIPYGASAKVKSKKDGEKLAKRFERIAKLLKLNLQAVLTDGSQPIGKGIGSVLEARDLILVLKQDKCRPLDLEKKSLYLSAVLLEMAGKAKKGQGIGLAEEILKSGKAYKKFKEIIEAQHGSLNNLDKTLQAAKFSCIIKASKNGKIKSIDNKKIAAVARAVDCPADKRAGLYLHHHVGSLIKKGDSLLTIYADSQQKLAFAKEIYGKLAPMIY